MAPGDGSPTPLSDAVSTDDLQRIAQLGDLVRYLGTPATEPAPPASPIPLPSKSAQVTYANLYAALRQMGANVLVAMFWAGFWAALVGVIGILAGWLGQIAGLVVGPLLDAFLTALDGLRKGIDPAIGILAVGILQELLGAEFSQAHLAVSTDVAGHIARAEEIGALLQGQLVQEFSPTNGNQAVASPVPAQRFTGFAVNFGVATGILAAVGGMLPIGHMNELRELGEEVARNIGLGRLVRRALSPLIDIMVAQPYRWYLNQKYHPTQIPAGMLFNPYAGGFVDPKIVHDTLDLEGWTTEKINAMIALHARKLTPGNVEELYRYGTWTEQQALDYLVKLGYPADVAPTVLQAFTVTRAQSWITKLVSEIETEVKAGNVPLAEFEQIVAGLPLLQLEKDVINATAAYKVKAHHGKVHTLSHGQLVTAFEHGLITGSDLTDHWTVQGYSAADQQVLFAEVLLTAGKLAEAKKVAQFNYDAKVAKALKAGQPQPPAPAILSS
jgi:hypothetical protein